MATIGLILVVSLSMFLAADYEVETIPTKDYGYVRDLSDTFESKSVIDGLIIEEPIEEPTEEDTESNIVHYSVEGSEEVAEPNRVIEMEATYYTAECKGCIGITKSGVDVRDTVYHEGKRIIAVDPEVVPLGTEVVVRTDNGEEFAATAQDIGSAIKGKRIDILVETKAEARRLGRVGAEVEIIN